MTSQLATELLVNPTPPKPVSRISKGDESDLDWFFGKGQSTFQGSTFGAMLDEAQRLSLPTESCTPCEGTGFVLLRDRRGRRWDVLLEQGRKREIIDVFERYLREEGESLVPAERKIRETLDSACPTCRGSGVVVDRRRRPVPPLVEIAREAHLRVAQGVVFANTCTAQPMSKQRQEHGYTPSDEDLIRFALVSIRLALVPRRHVDVLEAFYGNTGCRWARTKQGRLFAVYQLTDAGRKLLRRAAEQARKDKREPSELPDHEQLGTEWIVRHQGGTWRQQLFDSARAQSEHLLDTAADAWNDTADVVADRRRLR